MAQLAPPYLVKIAIDQYIAQGDLAGLNGIALVYLAVLVAAFSLEYAQTYMMQMIGQRIMFDMRMQIYAHLQRLDLSFYDRNPVGRLMTRVTTDVDVINDLFTSGVVAAFGDLFMLVGIMVTLLWMDWRLALIAFSVLPLILVLAQWFRRNVRESYRKVRLRIARINAFLNEHINGMATVQLFRREEVNYGRFDGINREHRDANVEQIFFYAVFLPAVEFVAAIATALILWYGGGFVLGGALTLGSLVAFILYAGRFFRPISDMSEKFNTLQAAMASSERIFQLLDTEVAVKNSADRAEGEKAKGISSSTTCRLRTRTDDHVLRNVSFEVKPGERVGIVGATGAGKSTLISLLLRFYDVTSGRILIDGVDIREMDLGELRRMFGLVLQDVHLFSGTIAGNIRLGDDSHRRRARARRGAGGARASVHRVAARRLRCAGRRTRRDAVGRPEAAAVVCARAGVRSGRADPGRGDVERRHRNRAADSRRAARADVGPHDAGDRAPSVDDSGHGQDSRVPQGQAARVGQPSAAAGDARDLLQAVSAAVQRPLVRRWLRTRRRLPPASQT